jgi:hypothetical protein
MRRANIILATVIVLLSMSASGAAGGAAAPVPSRATTEVTEVASGRLSGALTSNSRPRCASAKRAVVFYRKRTTYWNDRRSVPSRVGRKPHGCSDARYLAHVWAERMSLARRGFERWVERNLTLTDPSLRPGANAWLRAIDEAQKPYPGTEGWLISCSASEGGHGRWVPNGYGSGAGGWLQFLEGTFWRMWGAARSDVRSRGYRVPTSAASYYSPLGQALAGAWGVTHGRSHEWYGGGC